MTHPPSADKLVMVDFDGTIVPWGPLMGPIEPFPGVGEALQEMRRRGYRIGIFTSRLSETWMSEAATGYLEQLFYVTDLLTRYDIPFDFVTAEKLPAEAYFDDKAYHVIPGTLAGALLAYANGQLGDHS